MQDKEFKCKTKVSNNEKIKLWEGVWIQEKGRERIHEVPKETPGQKAKQTISGLNAKVHQCCNNLGKYNPEKVRNNLP